MRIAVGAQPCHELHGPCSLPEALEVLAEPDKGCHDIEVIHLNENAPPAVEENQLPQREQLEGAAEPGPHPPSCLGHAANLAELERVELDEPVTLAEVATADHDRRCPVNGHGPNVRTSAGIRTRARLCRRDASSGALAPSGPGRP